MDRPEDELRSDREEPGESGATGDSERVEEAVAQWGRRVSRFVASAAARAREEAEDIVAEAQSIRRGERE